MLLWNLTLNSTLILTLNLTLAITFANTIRICILYGWLVLLVWPLCAKYHPSPSPHCKSTLLGMTNYPIGPHRTTWDPIGTQSDPYLHHFTGSHYI